VLYDVQNNANLRAFYIKTASYKGTMKIMASNLSYSEQTF